MTVWAEEKQSRGVCFCVFHRWQQQIWAAADAFGCFKSRHINNSTSQGESRLPSCLASCPSFCLTWQTQCAPPPTPTPPPSPTLQPSTRTHRPADLCPSWVRRRRHEEVKEKVGWQKKRRNDKWQRRDKRLLWKWIVPRQQAGGIDMQMVAAAAGCEGPEYTVWHLQCTKLLTPPTTSTSFLMQTLQSRLMIAVHFLCRERDLCLNNVLPLMSLSH